jgi:hypothetical protein
LAGLDPAKTSCGTRLAGFRGYPAQGRARRLGSALNHLNASEHYRSVWQDRNILPIDTDRRPENSRNRTVTSGVWWVIENKNFYASRIYVQNEPRTGSQVLTYGGALLLSRCYAAKTAEMFAVNRCLCFRKAKGKQDEICSQ